MSRMGYLAREIRKMQYNQESVIGFDALYESMQKCQKGVMWKDSTAAFCLRGVSKVSHLEDDLKNGKYWPTPPKHFTIHYPKERNIASITFRDRVYQRSLNDNVVYPIMSRSFILDNYACQNGKGQDAARERLKDFLRKFYRKSGRDGFVYQLDIKGYYPNMDHQLTEALFWSKLPKEAAEQVAKILRDQYTGEKGYNPGSQLVQIAGISVLDELDHYIKEQLHIRFYLRYMDDLILIHEDKVYLEACAAKINSFLKSLKFEAHPTKTRLYPLAEPIPFLGFLFFLGETGKVWMHVKPEKVKAKRRTLRRMVAKSKRGELPRKKVDESYRDWRAHAEKGDSFQLLIRMDEFYENLWKEEVSVHASEKKNDVSC